MHEMDRFVEMNKADEMRRMAPLGTPFQDSQPLSINLPTVQPYHSNMVGDGLTSGEREFRRLQDVTFDYHQSRVNEGLKFITEDRTPDFASQLGNINLAEREMGIQFRPKPSWLDQDFTTKIPDMSSVIPKPYDIFAPATLGLVPGPEPIGYSAYMNKPLLDLSVLEPEPLIELAPIVRQHSTETVFGGAGKSHFSFENHDRFTGFHETTQVPGFGKREDLLNGLSLHTRITENKGVIDFLK